MVLLCQPSLGWLPDSLAELDIYLSLAHPTECCVADLTLLLLLARTPLTVLHARSLVEEPAPYPERGL